MDRHPEDLTTDEEIDASLERAKALIAFHVLPKRSIALNLDGSA